MPEKDLLTRLNGVYKPEAVPKTSFGRRPATREDLGRRRVTPVQIQRVISQEIDFVDAERFYGPTAEDIKTKEDK